VSSDKSTASADQLVASRTATTAGLSWRRSSWTLTAHAPSWPDEVSKKVKAVAEPRGLTARAFDAGDPIPIDCPNSTLDSASTERGEVRPAGRLSRVRSLDLSDFSYWSISRQTLRMVEPLLSIGADSTVYGNYMHGRRKVTKARAAFEAVTASRGPRAGPAWRGGGEDEGERSRPVSSADPKSLIAVGVARTCRSRTFATRRGGGARPSSPAMHGPGSAYRAVKLAWRCVFSSGQTAESELELCGLIAVCGRAAPQGSASAGHTKRD
jgi:hypothetical protein